VARAVDSKKKDPEKPGSSTPKKRSGNVFDDIANGTIDPIYLLTGAESFLVTDCLRTLRAAVLGGETGGIEGLNYDVFDLKESGMLTALASARTVTLLGGKRFVVARGIDLLKAADLDPLRLYAEDPNPGSVLVLLCDKDEKVDGRLKTFAALKKLGFLHEFGRLRDRELESWIANNAARRGYRFDGEAARALGQAAGPDLGRISQAIEQLATYAMDPKSPGKVHVTRADVEALIPDSREHQVFEIVRAITEGKRDKALQLVGSMFSAGTSPATTVSLLLVGAAARQMRSIWRARELVRSGMSGPGLAGQLGVPPFAVDDILSAARRISQRTLMAAIGQLYEADRSLKSSRIKPQVITTRLVQTLAEACAA